MPLNLPRIAAALNAYPWTAGVLTERGGAAPTYCAIGALLRYAGVAREHIACHAMDLMDVYGPLLEAEYGIADEVTVRRVIVANDSARSQAEAIDRVLGVLTGAIPPAALHAMRLNASANGSAKTESWEARPDDETGSLAVVG